MYPSELLNDAIHFVRRSSRTAIGAAAMLAIGLGANIAIFAIGYAVLLKPLPLADADRVVVMWEHASSAAVGVWEVSFPSFRAWQTQSSAFRSMAATGSINWSLRLMQANGPVPLPFAAVSGTFFDLLGVRPQVGRVLRPSDDDRGSARVAVISNATWRRRHAAGLRLSARCRAVDAARPDAGASVRRTGIRPAREAQPRHPVRGGAPARRRSPAASSCFC